MSALHRTFNRFEKYERLGKMVNQFNRCMERYIFSHPYIVSIALFILLPILLLMAVAICTTIFALLFTLIF